MKGSIIYKGKYGATRQYAVWIGDELKLPVSVPGSLDTEQLVRSDFIIIGSSVYMGKMLIADWLKKNIKNLQNKILFLFVVCGTPSSERAKQREIIEENVPAALLNGSNSFFLPGRLIRKGLSWSDQLLLKIGASLEKDPIKKKAMLEDIDGVKKENLSEMMDAIRLLTSANNDVIDEDIPVYNTG